MSDAKRQRATKAPEPSPLPSLDQIRERYTRLLKNYALDPLPRFTVVLEGTTDIRYLKAAAKAHYAEHGQDLLAVPPSLGGSRIGLVTPGRPGTPYRGGTARMVPMASDIAPFVFHVPMVNRLLFVFDHDDAGLRARDAIGEYGYVSQEHAITLNPRDHPGANAKKQVTIEQLISLSIQQRFFRQGNAWCSVEYEDGAIACIRWHHNSKSDLCNFVCENGTAADFEEVINLLRRIRRIFGFVD